MWHLENLLISNLKNKIREWWKKKIEELKNKIKKSIYILSSIICTGFGIGLAIMVPPLPLVGKFTSIIFASCGCLAGGYFLGKLSALIGPQENSTSIELQKTKDENVQLKKDIRDLTEKNKNLANSVICSFQFLPKEKLQLGEAKYKVQKLINHSFNTIKKGILHRAYEPQCIAMFSEDITQRWFVELANLRFRINDESKIEIYNAEPKIDCSYDNETWPMEAKIFECRKNDNGKIKEMLWKEDKMLEYQPLYKDEIKKLVDEEKKQLHAPFEKVDSDNEMTQSLRSFSKQQLQYLLQGFFKMAGFDCEIKNGDAPSGVITLEALEKEINTIRLQRIGMIKEEQQIHHSLADGAKGLLQESEYTDK